MDAALDNIAEWVHYNTCERTITLRFVATAMGADPSHDLSFPCNFYDREYVTVLQSMLLARVEDYP